MNSSLLKPSKQLKLVCCLSLDHEAKQVSREMCSSTATYLSSEAIEREREKRLESGNREGKTWFVLTKQYDAISCFISAKVSVEEI